MESRGLRRWLMHFEHIDQGMIQISLPPKNTVGCLFLRFVDSRKVAQSEPFPFSPLVASNLSLVRWAVVPNDQEYERRLRYARSLFPKRVL